MMALWRVVKAGRESLSLLPQPRPSLGPLLLLHTFEREGVIMCSLNFVCKSIEEGEADSFFFSSLKVILDIAPWLSQPCFLSEMLPKGPNMEAIRITGFASLKLFGGEMVHQTQSFLHSQQGPANLRS